MVDGQLPEDEELKSLCILAAREALGNAVRHGGAKKLFIRLRSQDDMLLMTLTNDGKLPENRISPKGGFVGRRLQMKGVETDRDFLTGGLS